MSQPIDLDRDWKTLISNLPPDYEELAEEHKQLNTQWKNTKITSADDLLRLIFVHVGADMPLRQTVATVAAAGGPSVAPVRLHLKMRRAKPYLAAMVARMTTLSADAAPELWSGYEMVVVDATTVSGPGSEGVDARLHAAIRLSDLGVLEAHVTNVGGGETLRRYSWKPGQLVIADRGYSNAPGIAAVVDFEADVLVRVNRGALPLFDDETGNIDVLAWCRTLSGHRASDRAAHIVHREQRNDRRIDGRLIAFRLPESEAEKARERVLRDEGAGATAEQLEAAEYVILFTTVPASRLSAARCVEAYRLRWQVELQFKRWKSICRFDRLPNYRDDTIQSWLTAKLLLGLLLDRIGSAYVPPPAHSSRSPRAVARQPWKLTSIIWAMMMSAIMPMGLAEGVGHLPAIVAQLDALDHRPDDRQITRFRDRFHYSPPVTNVHC